MAILNIVHYPAKVLGEIGKPVPDDKIDARLKSLVEDMFETMYEFHGVGLAAPQVGISERLFVMDCSGGEDESRKFAIINPEIVDVEGEQYGEEGCLSFPGVFTNVKRQLRAVVRFHKLDGSIDERSFTELEARCFLHETDHCDGIVFLDRMSALKRELAKRKIKKLKRTGEWV